MTDEENLIRRIQALPTPAPPSSLMEELVRLEESPTGSLRPKRRPSTRRTLMQTLAVASCLVLTDGVIWYTRAHSKTNEEQSVVTTYTTSPSDSARYGAKYYVSETGPLHGVPTEAQFRLRVDSWGHHAIYVGVTSTLSSAITDINVNQTPQNLGSASSGSAASTVGTRTAFGIVPTHGAPPAQAESADFAVVNSYLNQHGLSTVGFMQYINQKIQKYSVLQGFFTSTKATPLNDWRLVMADVTTNAGHKPVLKWIKIISPQQNRTLLEAAQAAVNPDFKNVRMLWEQAVGQYAFGLVSYSFHDQAYVLPVMEKRQPNSTWSLVLQNGAAPVTSDVKRLFNVYEMGGNGTVSNPLRSYLWQTGLVFNSAVVKVKIVLSNGHYVTVPVKNGAFGYAPPLVLGGKSEVVVRSLTAYDSKGTVVPMMKS